MTSPLLRSATLALASAALAVPLLTSTTTAATAAPAPACTAEKAQIASTHGIVGDRKVDLTSAVAQVTALRDTAAQKKAAWLEEVQKVNDARTAYATSKTPANRAAVVSAIEARTVAAQAWNAAKADVAEAITTIRTPAVTAVQNAQQDYANAKTAYNQCRHPATVTYQLSRYSDTSGVYADVYFTGKNFEPGTRVRTVFRLYGPDLPANGTESSELPSTVYSDGTIIEFPLRTACGGVTSIKFTVILPDGTTVSATAETGSVCFPM